MANPRLLPRCLACGATTRWRDGPHGPFVGCGRHPKCRETLSVAGLRAMLAKRDRAAHLAAARAAAARKRVDP